MSNKHGQIPVDAETGEEIREPNNTGNVRLWLDKFERALEILRSTTPLDPDQVTAAIGPEGSPAEMAQMFQELKRLHEVADEIKKQFGKTYDWFRVSYIPERMDTLGTSSMRVDGYGRLGLTDDLRVKILDKEQVYEWLEENDMGDMITETVNASILKASLRKRLQKGEEVPDNLFELAPFTRANLTKS